VRADARLRSREQRESDQQGESPKPQGGLR
jgi:hypothetical protein